MLLYSYAFILKNHIVHLELDKVIVIKQYYNWKILYTCI